MSCRYKTLKTRFLLSFGIVVALLLFAFALGIRSMSRQNFRLQLLSQMREEALHLHKELLPEKATDPQSRLLSEDRGFEAAVYAKGRVVAATPRWREGKCPFDAMKKTGEDFRFIEEDDRVLGCYLEEMSHPFSGTLHLARHWNYEAAEAWGEALAWTLPVLFVFLLVLAHGMLERILHPIRRLIAAAERTRVHSLATTLPPLRRRDEIYCLNETYNRMIERIREGVATLEQQNSDLSHELRTPLTVLIAESELALKYGEDSFDYHSSLQRILTEARKMERLVREILLIGRYTIESVKASFRTCRLDLLLQDLYRRFLSQAESKGIGLKLRLETVTLNCNPVLIDALCTNLLENALKYSDSGTITLVVKRVEEGTSVEIHDQGIGMTPEELEQSTRRYYRSEESRSKLISGEGIGLAIVKRIAILHRAQLRFHSQVDRGTTVKILFPEDTLMHSGK